MFGLMECDGMERNGMINSEIPLFGFVNNGWNGMEWNMMEFIPSHLPFFVLSDLGCMQWNEIFLLK